MNNQKLNLTANKSFYILFAVFILGIYILFGLLSKIGPMMISHTVYFCQQVVSDFMITLPHLLPPVMIGLLSLIALIGFGLLLFQINKTQVFVSRLLKKKIATSMEIEKIASELGMEGKITVVKDRTYISFCYGLLNPRICISNTMVKSLNVGELKAVLVHESYHVKNRDPLKILLSQIAASMFFFIPTLRDVHNYFILSKEINADKLVIQSKGVKQLKLALLKLLSFSMPSISGVATFANSNDLEQRIKVLTSQTYNVGAKPSSIKLLVSLMVFAAALFLLNLPVYAVENGMDDHTLFMCPFGDECVVSCEKQGITNDLFFSSQNNFSPLELSSQVPRTNYSINPLP